MRTDKIAYLWLQDIPEGFFALIGRAKEDALRYEYKSVELKETSFRIDGVFVPEAKDKDYTYFVEVQFQQDETFYARFFAEIFLYLKQFSVKKWRAVVIYPNRTTEQKEREAYSVLLESECVKRVYLDELPSIEQLDEAIGVFRLAIEPKPKAVEAAKNLVEKNPSRLDYITKLLFYKFENLTRKEILEMLSIREEFEEELKKTRAYQEILQEGMLKGYKQGVKEGFEEGYEEGIQKGIESGKLEGKLEGKIEGKIEGKLEAVQLLREAGFSDEVISERLGVPLQAVKSVPRT